MILSAFGMYEGVMLGTLSLSVESAEQSDWHRTLFFMSDSGVGEWGGNIK